MEQVHTKSRMTAQEVRSRCRAALEEWQRRRGGPLTCLELAAHAEVPYNGTATAMGHSHLVQSFVAELVAAGQARWLTDQRRNRAFTTNMPDPRSPLVVHGTETGRFSTRAPSVVELPKAPDSGTLITEIVRVCHSLLFHDGQRSVSESVVRSCVLNKLGITTEPGVERRLWLTTAWSDAWKTAVAALQAYGFWWRDTGSFRLQTRMVLLEVGGHDAEAFSRKVQTDTRHARRILEEISKRQPAEGGLLAMTTRAD